MEGYMVTENEQGTVDTVTEPQAEVQIEDNTQETVAETTEQPTAEGADNTAQTTTEEPTKIDMYDSSEQVPNQLSQEQLQFIANQQNEQLQHYKRMEEESRLREQAAQYRKQLENDGYDSAQAETAAQSYFKQQQDIKTQQDIAKDMQLEQTGRRNASLYYAKKYNLSIEDLSSLDKAPDPVAMEAEARRISKLKTMQKELSELKQKQVPPQQFDTNQPAASASGSEEELLDQYNSGVRNPQTEAAARRAAGLG